MTIQRFHKNTIKHRKNSAWRQRLGKSEKPENDTNLKILIFQENYHKPSLPQGLERFYKVTLCNEKCNFFILQQCITLILFFFIGTGSPRPHFRYIIHSKSNESSKYMIYGIYSNILSKWTVKIFHIHTNLIQWMRRIGKDTKFSPTLYKWCKFL